MRVAVVTTYRADKKEPLAALLERIYTGFLEAGLGEPAITFAFSDAPVPGFNSVVQRALKKFPDLHWYRCSSPTLPGGAAVDQIGNGPASQAPGRKLAFPALLEIARCVPRSLPFHAIMIHFRSAAFGEDLPAHALAAVKTPGIFVGDSWWINGRNRTLMALTLVDVDPAAKDLPSYPEPLGQVLAACGKVKDVTQLPLPGADTAATALEAAAHPNPGVREQVTAIVRDYRGSLAQIVEQARMPHALPSGQEALRETPLGTTSGPKKPALERAFKPLGYSCRGESGMFTLTRRTPSHLTIEISLDVGSWSNSLTAFYAVHAVGIGATLPLPPAPAAIDSRQYSIGDAERWRKIVENLAALVAELDRTFVPAIEAACGPTPAWYKPSS